MIAEEGPITLTASQRSLRHLHDMIACGVEAGASSELSRRALRDPSFAAEAADPFVEYVASLIEQTSGIRLARAGESGTPVDIYHGNDTGRPCRVRIPRVERYTIDTVPIPDGFAARPEGPVFPFDVFAATRFWLADEAHESGFDRFDVHGRLWPEASAQAQRGVLEIPVVNAYLLAIRSWLADAVGLRVASHLPPAKRCVVVLSHDVDNPIDPSRPGHQLALALANVRRRVKPATSVAYAAGASWHAAMERVRDPEARHFLFDDIVAAEQERGFRSTFFFASTSRYAPRGCRRDVNYDVARAPVAQAVRRLIEVGHGVGLHIGYPAGGDAGFIAEERSRLEAVAGAEVSTSRHHYFRTPVPLWQSLAAHAEAGLKVDSSISFNYVPGYRLGIALPFRPWDPLTRSPIRTLQVPTVLMDSMLFSGSDPDVDAALARIETVLTSLKRYEGVAAIDWHEYTSFPGSRRFRAWGETYLGALDLLRADPEVDVQTYDDLAAASV